MKQTAMALETRERFVNKTRVRLQRGDLTALPVDAFVFYAKENLELVAGFGTAIQSRGGDSVKKVLEKIGKIGMGEAIISPAGGLAAKHIIHACGPKFQELDTEQKLRACVVASLRCAAGSGLKSIALPPMGTGFYGVPLDLCSKVMLEVIGQFLRDDSSLETIIICVMDNREFMAFQGQLENL